MNKKKILQATSRGQITIPKVWRNQFTSNAFIADYENNKIILTPLNTHKTFEETIESSWEEYNNGEVTEESTIMRKYGL